MAMPTAMTDLTVDEATNVPADSETVTAALRPSDYLRAHAAIMRRPFAKGADVASATAANLGSNTDGDYFHITGTTGLAASNFGTVAAGIERTIVFDGALLLTHNATSFILPGGANITTAAGDVAVFRSEASGNWKCTSYVKASGAPVGSYQPLDADLTAIAALTTAAYGRSLLEVASEAALKALINLEIGTDVLAYVAPSTSGNVLTSNGSAWTSAAAPGVTSGTKQDASGTSIDFTGIPAGTKRVTIAFSEVSTNGTSPKLIQLGDSGGFETTGYTGGSQQVQEATGFAGTYSTAGIPIHSVLAADAVSGSIVFDLVDSATNTWVAHGVFRNSTIQTGYSAGSKALTGELTQLRFTTVNGSDTLDAGMLNVLYG